MELILDNLNVVWFILVATLFAGMFVLEGFDYGVGTLLPFIAKDDLERRQLFNALGPVWDGNQVWMITAGGALFASFPQVYATLFSGFYLALFLMLLVIIARDISFEFRSKNKAVTWRKTFDYCMFVGSIVPALLWGVAVGNLIQGTPIDAQMEYVGGFFTLLTPYTILCGIAFVLVFSYHGALYASLKVTGPLKERSRATALVVGVLVAVGALVLAWANSYFTDMYNNVASLYLFLAAIVLFIVSWVFTRMRKVGLGFTFSVLCIVTITASYFAGLFPRIMVSSLNPAWSLTITNASASQMTLELMTMATVAFLPIVLCYQAWNFWTFRKPVDQENLKY